MHSVRTPSHTSHSLLLLNFNEIGMSVAIIRWQGDPSEIVPTVRTISLAVSVVVYIGCFLAAPAYASAMGAPAASTIVRILALAVLSDGFTGIPAALLQRNFRQGKRTVADMVNVWLGTIVTVALAWSGYGAMSLAIGRLVGCVAGQEYPNRGLCAGIAALWVQSGKGSRFAQIGLPLGERVS